MTINGHCAALSTRARLSLLLAALSVLPASLSAQVPLATIVRLAERNSSSVHMAQANMDKARAMHSESRDAVIPSISFSSGLPTFPQVGFTGTPPSIYSFSVQSLVFGLSQKHYISAASIGEKATLASLKDAREQSALDASLAYVELDALSSELAVSHQQEEYAQRMIQIEQERAEAGVDSASAVLEARLTAAEIRMHRMQLESRAETLRAQLATLTGMAIEQIKVQHDSIPAVPELRGMQATALPGIEAARLQARSRQQQARADMEFNFLPQLAFGAQYNRNTTLLNDVDSYFARPLPANNFSSGISVQIPIFSMTSHAKARESAAESLRAKVEAEQAQRQADQQIATLTASLREFDAYTEVVNLKKQIAEEQLKAVLSQLELGNGNSSQPQLGPKAEQQARIDERQKELDALEAGLNLTKARLGLLRALGHMNDWLNELQQDK